MMPVFADMVARKVTAGWVVGYVEGGGGGGRCSIGRGIEMRREATQSKASQVSGFGDWREMRNNLAAWTGLSQSVLF